MIKIKAENQAAPIQRSTVLDALRQLQLGQTNVELTRVVDQQGNTVVHWAARLGCLRNIHQVIATRVILVRNQFDLTPLHVAAERGILEEVKVDQFKYVQSFCHVPNFPLLIGLFPYLFLYFFFSRLRIATLCSRRIRNAASTKATSTNN